VDLSEYTFVYTTDSEHKFEWIKESDGSYIVNPGDIYVIGVYSKWSADEGYKYDNDEELLKYWEGFNDFYNVNIPKTNRVMIACVESGNGENMLDGMSKLLRTSEVGCLVTAEMRKGEETVTKVSLPGEIVSNYHSYHYMPSVGESQEEKLLFCASNFPYSLLNEQKFEYCEKAYFDNNGKTKVMSYNILSTNDAGYTIEERFPLVMRTVEDFDPDIIGFQEVNKLWIDTMATVIEPEYSYVAGISRQGHNVDALSGLHDEVAPIYYKTEKYNLLESGGTFLTPDGKMNTPMWDSIDYKRFMTWTVLENKETKEIVSIVNSHLVLSGKVARIEQVKCLYEKGQELKEEYGGGIVITGDHNFHENTEPYQEYINSGIVADSKYMTTNHNSVSTHLPITVDDNISRINYGTPIDFCFVSPADYLVQKYEAVTGRYPEGAGSDHLAVTVELLDKNLITEHKNEIITYDKSKNSVFAEFVAGKEYQIIFADYENGKLVNSEIVPFKAGCDCYAWIKQSKTDLSLGKEDKIFIWDIKEGLKPVCNLYELSE